jgi:ATP-dependent RNA helicase RhlE
MTATTFADLGVSEPVRRALEARGIINPFPVQELVLPVAQEGQDVLVMSPTGSGKTLAFGLPLIQAADRTTGPSALILAPTRELACQIEEELTPLAATVGLRMAVCYGGVSLDSQARKAAKAHIIVATPGRLIDLMGRNRVDLRAISILVLDEADRMLDMGFLPQVKDIVRKLPQSRQTMFFSATLEGSVGQIAQEFTHEPVRLRVQDGPGTEEPLSDRLDHGFLACNASNRVDQLVDLIKGEDNLTLVFCRTKRGADRLSQRLENQQVSATAMHGDLSQAARERALKRFSQGKVRVLVATDVAARGIDLDDVGLVINFDPPEDQASYTHRVGRTARAGRSGRAVTLVMPEHADTMGRIALNLGLEDGWEATGYPVAAPKVLYGGRRRNSAFGPAKHNRVASKGRPAAPPRANRVARGSRPAA